MGGLWSGSGIMNTCYENQLGVYCSLNGIGMGLTYKLENIYSIGTGNLWIDTRTDLGI